MFALWKLVLLQKRILFFSPPPVGVACYRGRTFLYLCHLCCMLSLSLKDDTGYNNCGKYLLPVYCACLLASHGIPFGFETGSNPLFFTNVCDMDTLHNEHKYIACEYAH